MWELGDGEPDPDRHRRPNSYPAGAFAERCRAAAAESLEEFLIQLCLDPAVPVADGRPWYFPSLLKSVRDYQTAWIAERQLGRVTTEIGQCVNEALEYALESRRMVLIDGPARIGKSHAAKAWCAQRPGKARYVQVAAPNEVGESKLQSTPPPGGTQSLGDSGPSSLFRRVDWLACLITFAVTLAAYWWTLAPDLTLEDSGELAVASMYAGVPHPPGYPVWTVYTWLFTLLPFGGIAYRVGLSSAFAGALSCGLIAMMVSRGGSLLLEGISFFKGLERSIENSFCLLAGVVAGTHCMYELTWSPRASHWRR